MDQHYDAIIVGGRCAGAATAMLLARGGLRVLVIEAARPGTDTLSTHALMRGGVLQLHRWGLLDAVVDAGTPAIVSTEFAYGDEIDTVDIRPGGGISALRAPRRTVLDPLLLEAARAAGAEVRAPARVTRLLTDGDRVRGVEGIERGTGSRFRATAPLIIGADGRNSTVAQRCRRPFSTPRHGVWRDRLRLLSRTSARSLPLGVPTGGHRGRGADRRRIGAACGRVPPAPGSPTSGRRASTATYRSLLAEAAPELARSIGAAPPVGTLRAFPGQPGWIRASAGHGLGVGRRRRLFQGPHHRARHHRRPARRGTARPRGPRSTPRRAGPTRRPRRLRTHA